MPYKSCQPSRSALEGSGVMALAFGKDQLHKAAGAATTARFRAEALRPPSNYLYRFQEKYAVIGTDTACSCVIKFAVWFLRKERTYYQQSGFKLVPLFLWQSAEMQ